MEGADPPIRSASRRRGGREHQDPAPDQAGPIALAETTVVEPPDLDKTKKRYPVVILYVKGVSKQVRRVMKGYGLKVYFNPTNTLRHILVRL